MNEQILRCRPSGKRHPDWEALYEAHPVETMPWYHPALDPDLKRELTARALTKGSVLDIGTGPGNQAAHLARMGFQVTGTDLSPTAIRHAQCNSPAVRFVVDDILQTQLSESFDVVFDRGCFHVLDVKTHAGYVTQVSRLVKPGGWLFLKCFSTEQPPADFGPLRFSAAEIRDLFRVPFTVRQIRRTVYYGSTPRPPKALFAVLQRKA